MQIKVKQHGNQIEIICKTESKMRKIIFQGKYLTLTVEEINGHLYERVRLRPGLKIIAENQGKFLFIKEFRTHEKAARWKLVSGWLDKEGKTPLEVAQEELREEVSYRANKWKLFYRRQTPNHTIELDTYYFVAQDLATLPPQTNPDSDRVEKIAWLTAEEIKQKLRQREIDWDEDMAVMLMYLEEEG